MPPPTEAYTEVQLKGVCERGEGEEGERSEGRGWGLRQFLLHSLSFGGNKNARLALITPRADGRRGARGDARWGGAGDERAGGRCGGAMRGRAGEPVARPNPSTTPRPETSSSTRPSYEETYLQENSPVLIREAAKTISGKAFDAFRYDANAAWQFGVSRLL